MNTDRLSQLQALLADEPGDSFLRYAVALELKRLGRAPEAMIWLEQLLTDRPEHIPTYYQLAVMYAEAGRTAEAISACDAGALRCIMMEDRKARAELLALKATLEEDD
ncbi:MAG: hypothetical protein IPI81_02195 [Flavobacteriales bacterium]|nr:hypothetical protein [Flavobacteriales bacterium]